MAELRRLNLGCGTQRLEGWENHDIELDIRKRLPAADGSVAFIHAEHVVEHVTHREAWRFFEDCKRVLAPKGVVRISVPSIVKVLSMLGDKDAQQYLDYNRKRGWSDGSREGALRSTMFCHYHMALWSEDLLVAALSAVGFKACARRLGVSSYPELCNVEGHGRVIGKYINDFQSVAAEGVK